MCPFLQMRIYTFMVFCLRFNYFLPQRYCKSYNLRNYFSKILYFVGKKHVFICITCDFDVICLETVTQTYALTSFSNYIHEPFVLLRDCHVAIVELNGIVGFAQRANFTMGVDIVALFYIL